MNKSQKIDSSERSSVQGMNVKFNPAVFHNTLIGYPVSPEGEVELTAVTDLPRMKPLDQFAELFAPLEDLKLRAPLAGYLAPALNSFYVWDHFRKATMQLESDLEQLTKATAQLQSELEKVRRVNRQLNLELGQIRDAQGE